MLRLIQLLLLVALAIVVWRLVRNVLGRQKGGPYPPNPEPPKFEPTARCTRCGTHVPAVQLDPDGVCPKCLAR